MAVGGKREGITYQSNAFSFWGILFDMWPFRTSLVGGRAPDISGEAWFNVTSLPEVARKKVLAGGDLRFREELAGLVTVVQFWDYSCINCLHTLPHLREWWKRWREEKFLIIGVHTPEFEFAHDADKVESAVLRFELSYPVVSDPDFVTWQRYGNKVWPRILIVDLRGVIRLDRKGEGGYEEMEAKIEELLLPLR